SNTDCVVTLETEGLKRFPETVGLIVKIGDHDDNAATRQYLCQLMQRCSQISFAAGLEHREIAEDRAHVPGAIARGYVCVDLVCKSHEPNCILLAIQQVSQRRCEKLRILQLRDIARVCVIHRSARVDQQMTL